MLLAVDVKDSLKSVGETVGATMSGIHEHLGERVMLLTTLDLIGERCTEIGAKIQQARNTDEARTANDDCLGNMRRATAEASHNIAEATTHANSIGNLAKEVEDRKPDAHIHTAALPLVLAFEKQLDLSGFSVISLREQIRLITRSNQQSKPLDIRNAIGSARAHAAEALRLIGLNDPDAKLRQAETNVRLARSMCAGTIVPNLGKIVEQSELGRNHARLIAEHFGAVGLAVEAHFGHI